MPLDRLVTTLDRHVAALEEQGTAKGREVVISEVVRAREGRGPRYLLEGEGERSFVRMNSNSYLGLALHPEVIRAEEATAQAMGTGPGAVRFIVGTHVPHVELERGLAAFHGREAGMVFSSAYAAVVGTLVSLTDPATAVISDEAGGRSGLARLRDHPRRAPHRAAHAARHRRDPPAGRRPVRRRGAGDRAGLPRRPERRRGDPPTGERRPHRTRHRPGAGGAGG